MHTDINQNKRVVDIVALLVTIIFFTGEEGRVRARVLRKRFFFEIFGDSLSPTNLLL